MKKIMILLNVGRSCHKIIDEEEIASEPISQVVVVRNLCLRYNLVINMYN